MVTTKRTCVHCGGPITLEDSPGAKRKYCSMTCSQAANANDRRDWRAIADGLAAALASFMAYDGYGQGGADDSNRGDWRAAEKAINRYEEAGRDRRRLGA